MATIEDFKSWIERDITRLSSSEDHVGYGHYYPDGFDLLSEKKGEPSIHVTIFTDNNRYKITAIDKKHGGYLGCISSSRKPRAGEDWTRGRDLADGDLSEETWHEILGDIVSYEMVKIHKKVDGSTTNE